MPELVGALTSMDVVVEFLVERIRQWPEDAIVDGETVGIDSHGRLDTVHISALIDCAGCASCGKRIGGVRCTAPPRTRLMNRHSGKRKSHPSFSRSFRMADDDKNVVEENIPAQMLIIVQR